MNSLGQLLIDHGLVSAEQIEEALRRQAQLGGRLGTCLLETGAIDERQLYSALVDQLGIPAARVEDLRGVSEDIHSLLPANLAISCEAVPFRVRDDQVDVAILEIKNRGLHDELAFVIGKWIRVHIANEARIFEALERYYGKDCTPRYRALLERLDRERDRDAGPEPAVPSDVDDLVNTPFPDLEGGAGPKPEPEPEPSEDLRGPKLVYPPSPMRQRSIELTSEEHSALLRRELEPEPSAEPPEPSEPPEAPEVSASTEPEAGEVVAERTRAQETIELFPKANVEPHPSAPWKAESAEQIGQSLLRELGRQFRRVALYRVGREGVRGWIGKGDGFDSARFSSYRAELSQGSVFDSLASGGHLYLGRLTRSVAHDELLAAIGSSPDTECMLTAVSVGGRVVALTYGDRGAEGLDQTDIAAVQQVASRAGEAMRELILRRKLKQA